MQVPSLKVLQYRQYKVKFENFENDLKEEKEELKFTDLELIFKDLKLLFEKIKFLCFKLFSNSIDTELSRGKPSSSFFLIIFVITIISLIVILNP